jgi:Na+:H+ antiporter, NhaA family
MSHDHHIPTASHKLRPEPSERLFRPFHRFASMSSAGGIVLLAMTVVAMVWANSKYADSYERVFHDTQIGIKVEHHPHHAPGHGDDKPDSDHAPETDNAVVGHQEPDAHHTGPAIVSAMDGLGIPEGTPQLADELADQSNAHPNTHDDTHEQAPYFFMAYGLTHWINDLLMAIFFLVVGLEIKREVLVGELASPKRAALPIFGALGGMIAPAAIFAAINWGNPDNIGGWGVPMATDIAFAVGVMAMLGNKIPNSLKVFLLSLAIVDDLGALVVIAVFYTENLQMQYLGYAGSIIAVLLAMNILRVRWITAYLLLGLPLWYCVYQSGVHATIAGVLLAFTIPAHARVNATNFSYSTRKALEIFDDAHDDKETDVKQSTIRRAAVFAMITNARLVLPPLHRMETVLHPWAAFFIIPVFALANAGIPVHGGVGEVIKGDVSLGIIAGLFIGKPLGITLLALIACKLGIAALPRGVTWKHIIGAGMLGGIGFTMAIFIANLAYESNPYNLEHAKLAILVASALSAVAGAIILSTCKSQPEPEPATLGPAVGEYDENS